MARRSVAIPIVVAFVASVLGVAPPAVAASGPYTALGDSYSSGVGTRSYYSSSGSCYRSPYAFPVLSARQTGVTLTFAACSGAKVADVRNNQLGSLNSSTRFVSVSVGGNDAGFAGVITQCAKPWPYTCWSQINEANRIIRDVLPARLNGLYGAIKSKAPNARVLVVGYPRLFNGEQCNYAARISPGEQAELNKTANLLADTTRARAVAYGLTFIDVRTRFTGHAVCDDVEWINGLSNPVMESYHPNRAGQSSGYAPLVSSKINAPVPVPA